ncbi:MAG TPA: response regulator [Azospira sp.]|nr:response regulator [Azospira sp.]
MVITIFIAENSRLLRERLVHLIEESGEMQVIGQTGCVTQVQPQLEALAPDVALLDIHLDGGSAFGILGDLRRAMPDLGIALMTASGYPGYQKKALGLGADSLIDKSSGIETIIPTLMHLGRRRRAAQ